MTEHVLRSDIWLQQPPELVFPFFAQATNLGAITPPWLHFRILTPLPIRMAKGTLIEYRIRLHGVPMRWRTLISDWNPPHLFVDEQIRGPYRLWHHTHTFTAEAGGTKCTDVVRYAAPGGRVVHDWFVRPRLDAIFAYRREAILRRLGGQGVPSVASGNDAMNDSHSAPASVMSSRSLAIAASAAPGVE